MVGRDPPADELELAEHGRFVRNLALRLLRDDDAADEVVQETMLAAVKARPDRDRPLRPWLATVARNVIRKRFRGDRRRRTRETAAAKPEALPSTADMAARAEMLREVVDAVLSLEEPNRSTVLLRYYEDLPPREIAKRQQVGVETVRGRLKRAAAQIRRRLDALHPNGRAGWAPVLAGLAGLELPAEFLAGASGAAAEAAGSAPAPSLTGASASAGGAKGFAAAFLLGAALSGATTVGAVVVVSGAGPDAPSSSPAGGRTASDHPASVGARTGRGVEDSSGPAGGDRPDPHARLLALARENAELRERAARARAELDALAPPAPDPRAFHFGLPERTPAYDGADWAELARHVRAMTELMLSFKRTVTSGEPVTPAFVARIREHNTPLAMFAIQIGSELGAPGPNEAYTHPSVIANLIRAALEIVEKPLTHEQAIAIRTLGEAWDADVERIRSEGREDQPTLRRVVAEVDAKLRFLDAVKDVLSLDQRRVLFHPETEGRLSLDLLSPGLVYVLRHPVTASQPAELEAKLLIELFATAGIQDVEDLSPYQWIAREWADQLGGDVLAPQLRYAETFTFPRVQEAQRQARLQVEAAERILALGRLTTDQADALRRVEVLLAPRYPER